MKQSKASRKIRSAGPRAACFGVFVFAVILSALPAQKSVYAQGEPSLAPANRVAAPKPPQQLVPLHVALETRGDLSLQNSTIQQALFTIGATWKVNVVVGKEVEGTVSCIYNQAPLREVLDAILLANGYSYRAVGESLVVQRVQEVGSANPLFQSASITVTHSDLAEVVEGAKLLLSSQGQLQSLESANSILVVDFADRVQSIREFVANMDGAASASTGGIPAESYKRLQVAYFHTQFIPVENCKNPVSAVLSTTGKVATMPAENRLVVVDYPSNIELVERVLEKIDRARPQVRITALIYDISLADIEQLGLNWNHSGKSNGLATTTTTTDGVSTSTSSSANPSQALTFDSKTIVPGTSGSALTIKSLTRNFDITAVAVALQNAKDARLLADPHVTVEENETASMSSVQEIPFQQITQSELGGQIGTTEFKPVGITLEVTPQIAEDGTVKMLVDQTFSRVAGFTENDNQPIVDSRTATTSVRVANRQTLVIGGLRQRSDTGDFNGIPFLKDMHFIGPLFRSRDTNVRESELIVFIQPEIVDFDEPMRGREYLAMETINCRLEAIPPAEGCPTKRGDCGPSEFEPVPFPSVESEFQYPAYQQPMPQYNQAHQQPLRHDFDNRFRSTNPGPRR